MSALAGFFSGTGGRVVIAATVAIFTTLGGFSVGKGREHARGLVAQARCDSTTQAKNAEIARLGTRSDSLLRIIEVRREVRHATYVAKADPCGCSRHEIRDSAKGLALGLITGGILGAAIAIVSNGHHATAIATATASAGSGGGHGHRPKPRKGCK